MTFREWITQEHPEKLGECFCGGVSGCPGDYFEDGPIDCGGCGSDCDSCWDREIPGPKIADSGNRREFESGAVRDMAEGKGRMDLLPWAAIMEVSKHCENGSKKYGPHNVDKGINTASFADSGARHLAKWIDGWDDEPHLLAAAWNLLWAIQMEKKHPELCDIPWRDDKCE